jgi:hypothetical protein
MLHVKTEAYLVLSYNQSINQSINQSNALVSTAEEFDESIPAFGGDVIVIDSFGRSVSSKISRTTEDRLDDGGEGLCVRATGGERRNVGKSHMIVFDSVSAVDNTGDLESLFDDFGADGDGDLDRIGIGSCSLRITRSRRRMSDLESIFELILTDKTSVGRVFESVGGYQE